MNWITAKYDGCFLLLHNSLGGNCGILQKFHGGDLWRSPTPALPSEQDTLCYPILEKPGQEGGHDQSREKLWCPQLLVEHSSAMHRGISQTEGTSGEQRE